MFPLYKVNFRIPAIHITPTRGGTFFVAFELDPLSDIYWLIKMSITGKINGSK